MKVNHRITLINYASFLLKSARASETLLSAYLFPWCEKPHHIHLLHHWLRKNFRANRYVLFSVLFDERAGAVRAANGVQSGMSGVGLWFGFLDSFEVL